MNDSFRRRLSHDVSAQCPALTSGFFIAYTDGGCAPMKSRKKMVLLWEVIPIWNGDGVLPGREPLTPLK